MRHFVLRLSWTYPVAMLGLVCILLGSLIPPFMSPDEVDHVKRAYWLSQGKIILDTEPGQSSGGQVDTGLMQYINSYYLTFMKERNHKMTAAEMAQAPTFKWSGTKVYSSAPGTGYYLPITYAPQAAGLGIGRAFNFSVDTSYKLARAFSLVAAIAILYFAIALFEMGPLAAALLLLPMTLFQFSSASLDGVTNAMAVLAISLFLHLSKYRRDALTWTSTGLAVVVFILVTSRAHLLPMLALPFAAFYYTRERRTLVMAAFASVVTLIWLAIAVHYTVDMRVVTGASTGEIVKHYLFRPWEFLQVVYNTLANPIVRNYYSVAFIGNLGWLDTPIYPGSYTKICYMLALLLLLSLKLKQLRRNLVARAMLAACGVLSVLLTFFAILVTYNAFPATEIQGVQGRYFLVPAIMLAYAMAFSEDETSGIRRVVSYLMLGAFFVYSAYCTIKLVVDKYYIISSVTG